MHVLCFSHFVVVENFFMWHCDFSMGKSSVSGISYHSSPQTPDMQTKQESVGNWQSNNFKVIISMEGAGNVTKRVVAQHTSIGR